ncbi:MAG TPA: hypothetical protein PK299_09330 [Anaerolineales bacterium]|nr:hypothetical protein [Anaerolineales bacterium]
MILPLLLIGGLLATLYAGVAHALWGKSLRGLFGFILASWVGFWLGHWAGVQLGWGWLAMGNLYIVPATLGALALLYGAAWLEKTSTR